MHNIFNRLGGVLKNIFLVIIFFLISDAANASTQDTFRFGWMPVISIFNVVDPNGPTAQGNAYSGLSGIVIMDAGRDSRLIGHLVYDKFSITASTINIAQDVSRTGGSVSYQTNLRIARGWKPWVGAGLGEVSETYKNRYRLTPSGFSSPLADQERSVNNVFILVNTSTEWQVNKQWDMGVNLQYEHPIGEGSQVFRVGIYAVF